MKLKKEFLVQSSGRDSYLVPTGAAAFVGLVRGNATLGRVLELLHAEQSRDGLIDALGAEFDADKSVIAADVDKALAALREIGALEE